VFRPARTATPSLVHELVLASAGQQASFTIEYGTTTSFGSIIPVVALDNANAFEPVTATATSLAPDTTYLYRIVAINASGTSVGGVRAFTTGPVSAPLVTTGAATNLTAAGARLNATVDTRGRQTSFAFAGDAAAVASKQRKQELRRERAPGALADVIASRPLTS
jgi:phosphodiesterase/alkaline phosphatase D-like protein